MFLPPMPFHKPGSLLGTPPGLSTRWGRAVSLPRLLLALALVFGLAGAGTAHAERLKNLVTFQGVRDNPLIGYGLVVGLDNTGDQTMQTPFTTQSITNMLSQLGVTLPAGKNMQLKNVAAVMVTATLPPYAQPGSQLDVVVSSMGNAKSLRGGTLLMTPLKGADGQVYAIAQGNMLVGGAGAAANGSKVQINQLAVGRIANGAVVERAVAAFQPEGGYMNLELKDTDFGTAERVVDAINRNLGPALPPPWMAAWSRCAPRRRRRHAWASLPGSRTSTSPRPRPLPRSS